MDIYNDDEMEENPQENFVLPKIPIRTNPTKQFKVEV